MTLLPQKPLPSEKPLGSCDMLRLLLPARRGASLGQGACLPGDENRFSLHGMIVPRAYAD